MTNVYELRGTRDRRKRAAPQPPVGRCPAGETDAVQAAWRAFARELPSLARSDRCALLALCRLKVQADRAYAALDTAGQTQRGAKQPAVLSAQYRAFMGLNEALVRSLGRFGGTPVRRASVPPTAPPDRPGSEHLTG